MHSPALPLQGKLDSLQALMMPQEAAFQKAQMSWKTKFEGGERMETSPAAANASA